jgi:hypothetical protein
MSLKICDTIIIRVEDNKAILWSVVRTIERFQSMLAKKVPPAYRYRRATLNGLRLDWVWK